MKKLNRALRAEILKNSHSPLRWISFAALALVPVFGGVFTYLMLENGLDGLSGGIRTKVEYMSFEANWASFLGILSQGIGIGGVVVFGFVGSWLFGREYAQGTAKDLLALPIRRSAILNAKFIYYALWCIALALFTYAFGLLVAFLVGLPGFSAGLLISHAGSYALTVLMVILLNTPVAFAALYGRGYLVPLGLVIAALIIAQIFGALGLGQYFPWAMPGLYSGSGGPEMKASLDIFSYLSVLLAGLAGYLSAILWWGRTDQG